MGSEPKTHPCRIVLSGTPSPPHVKGVKTLIRAMISSQRVSAIINYLGISKPRFQIIVRCTLLLLKTKTLRPFGARRGCTPEGYTAIRGGCNTMPTVKHIHPTQAIHIHLGVIIHRFQRLQTLKTVRIPIETFIRVLNSHNALNLAASIRTSSVYPPLRRRFLLKGICCRFHRNVTIHISRQLTTIPFVLLEGLAVATPRFNLWAFVNTLDDVFKQIHQLVAHGFFSFHERNTNPHRDTNTSVGIGIMIPMKAHALSGVIVCPATNLEE